MVKALHRAGIEVILDVVYNHTAEGNHLGPMLSFKGVDNRAYYRLVPDDPRHYMDFTGTGNSLNPVHPSVLRLIMDSLRYWVIECHVDGFRFDLASALAREFYDVDRLSAFFDVDPPGPGALAGQADRRAVGRRARAATRSATSRCCGSEWNGIYRDTCATSGAAQASVGDVRRAPHRAPATSTRPTAATRSPRSTSSPPTTASRCATSSPTTTSTTRPTSRTTATAPTTTAPGTAASRAPTDDPEIIALRARQQRNFLATLLLSQGVPMLLGGDELGRTQHGNNNAWCQDNEISWFDWELDDRTQAELLEFTRRLIGCAASTRSSGATRFLAASELDGLGAARRLVVPRRRARDDPARLAERRARARACSSTATRSPTPGPHGEAIADDSFLLLFNAARTRTARSRCRAGASARSWALELSTADPTARARERAATAPAPRSRSSRARSLVAQAGARERAATELRAPTGCS